MKAAKAPARYLRILPPVVGYRVRALQPAGGGLREASWSTGTETPPAGLLSSNNPNGNKLRRARSPAAAASALGVDVRVVGLLVGRAADRVDLALLATRRRGDGVGVGGPDAPQRVELGAIPEVVREVALLECRGQATGAVGGEEAVESLGELRVPAGLHVGVEPRRLVGARRRAEDRRPERPG